MMMLNALLTSHLGQLIRGSGEFLFELRYPFQGRTETFTHLEISQLDSESMNRSERGTSQVEPFLSHLLV